MNEQDREALDRISPGPGCETASWRHLRTRLDYTDKLERAIAWLADNAGSIEWHPYKISAHSRRGAGAAALESDGSRVMAHQYLFKFVCILTPVVVEIDVLPTTSVYTLRLFGLRVAIWAVRCHQ